MDWLWYPPNPYYQDLLLRWPIVRRDDTPFGMLFTVWTIMCLILSIHDVRWQIFMLTGMWDGIGKLIAQHILCDEQFRAEKYCRHPHPPPAPIGMMLQSQPRDVNIHASFTQHIHKRFWQKSYTRVGLSLISLGMASISMNLADYAAMTFYANVGLERINAFKAQIGLTPPPSWMVGGWERLRDALPSAAAGRWPRAEDGMPRRRRRTWTAPSPLRRRCARES